MYVTLYSTVAPELQLMNYDILLKVDCGDYILNYILICRNQKLSIGFSHTRVNSQELALLLVSSEGIWTMCPCFWVLARLIISILLHSNWEEEAENQRMSKELK